MEPNIRPVVIKKVVQSLTYTALVLSTKDKDFAIYMEPQVGKNIQKLLSQPPTSRPLSINFIQNLIQGMEGKLFQVILYEAKEGVFFSKIFLEEEKNGLKNILEIDSRPSDALTLALLHNIPIYSTLNVIQGASAFMD